MNKRSLLSFLTASAVVAIPIACSKKGSVEIGSPQPPTTSSSTPAYYPSATVATSAPPPATTPPPATASASAPPPANTGPSVFDTTAQEMLRVQLQPLATKHAPGMKPDGPLVGGVLKEGQTAEGQVMLMPGKCYTVVGTGQLGVQELDLQMTVVTPLPTLSPVLAQDSMTGPIAVIGDKPNCYKIPAMMMIATPVKIIVRATKGMGLAGAQMYAK
jgi:hypothetical protein